MTCSFSGSPCWARSGPRPAPATAVRNCRRRHPAPPAAPWWRNCCPKLGESGDRFVLVIDDLHELSAPEAAGQLTTLLTRLPPGVRAIVATRRDLPVRLHRLRLAGDLAEIRAAELRFTEDETRRLLAAAGIALAGRVAAMLHQRTEGWAAGLRLAVLSMAGHPDRTVRRRVLRQRPHGG